MTPRAYLAYADFFARLPSVIVYISVMSFTLEYLAIRSRA